MVGPTVSGEVAWSVPATVRQDRWLSKTEPGLQTRLHYKNGRSAGFPLIREPRRPSFYFPGPAHRLDR